LVYLDNAATGQKPRSVIEAVNKYYRSANANVHRGVHTLSMRATYGYEEARGKLQRFVNAPGLETIIFTRGTTECINLVASSWGRANVGQGDEILISTMEHHSNIVPWQMLCEQVGATLRVIPINDAGEIMLTEYDKLLGARTRLVGLGHISNALGTVNPVQEMTRRAHAVGAVVLIDGAQAAPHHAIDVQALDADFYTISGHKMFGPTGIGALYGKKELLDAMPPYQGGGEMIRSVSFEKTEYAQSPAKFEAGTPNIAGAVGLGVAVDYLTRIGLEKIAAYEHELLIYGTEKLTEIPQVRLIGTAAEKAAVLSFVIDGVHPHDAGTILDQQGIAIRTGHHCAQPVMDRFGVPATCRASLALYNTRAELDALADGVRKVIEMFE
jgi:cysteine desulfurase/selenocysteine lyase